MGAICWDKNYQVKVLEAAKRLGTDLTPAIEKMDDGSDGYSAFLSLFLLVDSLSKTTFPVTVYFLYQCHEGRRSREVIGVYHDERSAEEAMAKQKELTKSPAVFFEIEKHGAKIRTPVENEEWLEDLIESEGDDSEEVGEIEHEGE